MKCDRHVPADVLLADFIWTSRSRNGTEDSAVVQNLLKAREGQLKNRRMGEGDKNLGS